MKKVIMRTVILFVISMQINCQNIKQNNFICPPCDLQCDALTFEKDGVCPHCNMNLIMNVEVSTINEIRIEEGSGNFLIEGGESNKEKTIRVFYHRPSKLDNNSKVLLVVPGAGRNGDNYRDDWIEKSEKYNVLVLSPEYSKKNYPSASNYNLAGMITNLKYNEERTAITSFKISKNSNEWIFDDFDRIFNLVKDNLTLNTDTYDMFGHSAGGQILHRLAIFKSNSKANRILASNSGWYTVPTNSEYFPTGLKGSYKSEMDIDFSKNLVLFLGEKDDSNETRGDLRRSPEVDKQGLNRLERGTYFYNESKKIALKLNFDFNWKLEIIPDVGHDYKEMSKSAADYLYKDWK